MDDRTWERYAALGGFAFVVLNVIGAIVPGTPPALDDSAEEITKFFRDHDTAIMLTQLLGGLGTIGLAWWFGSLFRRMRAAEGGNPRLSVVALLGLAIGGACAATSGAISAAAAMRVNELETGTQIFFTLSNVMIATAGFGVIIFLSAVCALNYRTNMFPAWTNYLGWVSAAAFLVATLGTVSDAGGLGLVGLASFLVWCIWIIAISTMMWRTTS